MVERNKYDVSVIIPIHNNENYLSDCINSILFQSMIDRIEIICVDDGSTDKSLDLINRFREQNENIVIIHQENKGAGFARNHGLEVATGQYIMFIDGDDFYADNHSIEKLYNCIIEKKKDICYGNMFRMYKDRIVRKMEHDRKYSNFDYEGLIQTDRFAYPFIHVLCIYNKEFLKNNKLEYPNRKRGEDGVFCAEALRCTSEIYHINEPIYVHRITESKRLFRYEIAIDYVESWKTIIDRSGIGTLCKAYANLASIELRIFAMLGWYIQVEKNDDWKLIDSINGTLKMYGAPKLLNKSEWEKRGIVYWKESLSIFIYRAWRRLQKDFFYVFNSTPVG